MEKNKQSLADSMRESMDIIDKIIEDGGEWTNLGAGDYVRLDINNDGPAGRDNISGSEYDGVLGKVQGGSFDEMGLDTLAITTSNAEIAKYLPDYAKPSWRKTGDNHFTFEIRPWHLVKAETPAEAPVENTEPVQEEGNESGVELTLRDEQQNTVGDVTTRIFDVKDAVAGEDMPWIEAIYIEEKDLFGRDTPVKKRWSIKYADKTDGEKTQGINLGNAREDEVKKEIRKLIDHGRVVYARTHFGKKNDGSYETT